MPTKKPAPTPRKPPPPDPRAENDALRTLLEVAAKFLLVRDQASCDELRAGLIKHHIIQG